MRGLRIAEKLFLVVVTLIICAPIALIVVSSLQQVDVLQDLFRVSSSESMIEENKSFPFPLVASYIKLLIHTSAFHNMFDNSLEIVILILLGQLVISVPAAWCFARYSFKGKNALFCVYIVCMLLPFQVVLLPDYLLFHQVGLVNSLLAVILPGIFSSFPIFVMEHFFEKIPDHIIEAARVDGASEVTIFFTIGLPLGSSGIYSALMLSLFEYWNAVEQPLAYLRDESLWPLSLFRPELQVDNIGLIFAAAVMSAIPAILVFACGQDWIEQGIATTTRK